MSPTNTRKGATSGTKEWADTNVNLIDGCAHDCLYCVDENTEILMFDSSVKKAKDVQIGDKVIGITKDINYMRIVPAVIEEKWYSEKLAWKIVLDNGIELTCSGDHGWLTNRGWKFTDGKMSGEGRRPYLTINNTLRRVYLPISEQFIETNDYMKGYLCGLIRGDGVLKKYVYDNIRRKGADVTYQFRITMEDDGPLIRARQYLSHFGIATNWFKFMEGSNGIRKNDRASFEHIQELVVLKETREFLRGYVGGFFDSEGSFSCNILRMGDIKQENQEMLIRGLELFSFDYAKDQYDGKKILTTRVRGGVPEYIRFFQTFNPANIRRRLLACMLKQRLQSKIISIECLGRDIRMVDFQTSTETFIANGIVSHNCYAKKMAIRFGRKTAENWHEMSVRVKDANKKYQKRTGRIMFPTSHDLVPGPTLEPCMGVLFKLLRAGNNVLVTTKPHLAVVEEIVSRFGYYKSQIQFRFTITSADDSVLKEWEPGAPPFAERLAALKHAFMNDFKTSISCEPALDYLDGILRLYELTIPYVTESFWIGTMNYCTPPVYLKPDEIMGTFGHLPKIKFKDSIRNQLVK